jgi:hypothetical protein
MPSYRVRAIMAFLAAWVLWIQYERFVPAEQWPTHKWVPEAAYPDDQHSRCVADARTLAQRAIQSFGSAQNVESAELRAWIGDRQRVSITLKQGGTLGRTYACFPHTVTPEGADSTK